MIFLKNVSKSFEGGNRGVFDLSFEIQKGESCLLRGESGSGKSTLLALISAMIRPDFGEIRVGDRHLWLMNERLSARWRLLNVGFIFQRFHLLPHLSLFENVALPLVPLNMEAHEIEERVERVLERFSLKERAHRAARGLSGGELQRVAIARALVNNPAILLADEPVASLDSRLKHEFIEILKGLKSEGHTIMVASHDMELLECGYFEREIRLHNGRIDDIK